MKEKIGQILVETVIYVLIGLALIGIVLFAVKPKIDSSSEKVIIEQSINSLKNLDDKIKETIDNGKGNVRNVNDFSLKKGELKVTVIATNFPADMPRKSLFGSGSNVSQTLLKEDNANQAKKDISNTIGSAKGGNMGTSNEFIKKRDGKKSDASKEIIIEDDTDDWSAVPAFLRRKK